MSEAPSRSVPDNPARVRTSPGVTTAWLAVGSIAAVLGLVFGVVQVVGVLAHEERTEVATISDPAVAVLDVASDVGRVEIIGANVTDVRITARVSDGMVATDFRYRVVGDRLEVRVRCNRLVGGPWCGAALRILVPRNLEVHAYSDSDQVIVRGISGRVDAASSDGSVEAEGLSGAAFLHSSNGSVRASRLRTNSIQANSDNGSVRLEFDRAAGSTIAKSANGNVEISVPRDGAGYAIDISSGNGSTDNQVQTDSTSARRVVASSENGNVTVRYLD